VSENERLREVLKRVSGELHYQTTPRGINHYSICKITAIIDKALYTEPDTCVWKEIDSEDQDTWPMDGEFVLIMCADGDHFAGTMHVCKFVPFWYRDGHMVPEFSMPGHGGIIASHWMSLPTAPAAGAKSR